MEGRIITISRQCGSGGHSIGNELAICRGKRGAYEQQPAF